MTLGQRKPLKISVKFVKSVKQKLISVGFPDVTLAFSSYIFMPFVKMDKHARYFELKDTDVSIADLLLRMIV